MGVAVGAWVGGGVAAGFAAVAKRAVIGPEIGVPSALVAVIEGLTMLFVLAGTVRRA